MLKKAFVISFTSLFIFICLFLTNLFILTTKDLQKFKDLTDKKTDIETQKAYQKRKNIRKDLFIHDKEDRNHYIITSHDSEIFLDKKNQKYELIENLKNLNFICIEKSLNKNISNIKYMESLEGCYHFPTHKLDLKNVDISFFNNFNKDFEFDPKKAYFLGKAKEMYFSIYKKKPCIEAYFFEGSFNPKKGLK